MGRQERPDTDHPACGLRHGGRAGDDVGVVPILADEGGPLDPAQDMVPFCLLMTPFAVDSYEATRYCLSCGSEGDGIKDTDSEDVQEGTMDTSVIERVIEQLKGLPQELQWRVLEFTRALALSAPRGIPGQHLMRFAGILSLEDAQLMRAAIEQGCEQVDPNEW